jgi:hypothetical protein
MPPEELSLCPFDMERIKICNGKEYGHCELEQCLKQVNTLVKQHIEDPDNCNIIARVCQIINAQRHDIYSNTDKLDPECQEQFQKGKTFQKQITIDHF